MSFNNKKYFKKQAFELSGNSLIVHKRGIFDEVEYEVPLENIHNKKIVQTQINNDLIVLGVFLFAFSFLSILGDIMGLALIFAAVGLLSMFCAFFNRKKSVSILTYSDDPIILYFKRSNKQDVIDYSNKIIKASNDYLLNKYSRIDRDLPIEPQIAHLKFLIDREIITDNQFDVLKNQLLGRDGKSPIGFGK